MTLYDLASQFELSLEERQRLSLLDDLFTRTATHTNLVARSTLPDRWQRHYADSLQLWPLLPERASTVLDIGTGAGFPGLLLAILAVGRRQNVRFVLADSVGKKARFVAEAADMLGLTNVEVTDRRVERLTRRFDVVTARAVTALPRLLDLAAPRLNAGGVLIFPKGARAEDELGEASQRWRMATNRVESITDPEATILVITDPERFA